MKVKDLKKIIEQVKKYNLTSAFSIPSDLDDWLKSLNNRQIQNLISLNIEPNKLDVPPIVMVNEDLLNCKDYSNRLEALSKIKNCEGYYQLYENFCSPHFLNKPTFYEDLELISKAPTARYALWVIGKESFNNSPYRNEDLKMIVEAKDTPKEKDESVDDCLVAESLATVAEDKLSISSKYHKEDMKLIASSGSECLQMTGSYPERGMNRLAINKVSLSDPYHLENMKILSENPVSAEYLFKLMTDQDAIKRGTYRQEIDALRYAKSEITALAMYIFITNPRKYNKINEWEIHEKMQWHGLNVLDYYELGKHQTIDGYEHPNYLQSLYLLNEVADEYVLFFAELLANKSLLESGYQDQDLDLLLTVHENDLFIDLFKLMSNHNSSKYSSHQHDIEILLQTEDEEKRKLLLSKATNIFSLKSQNHCYDMEYLAKLNIEEIDKETYKKMYYYLFNENGISNPKHIEILERLYNGIPVSEINELEEHLLKIENNIDEYVASTNSHKKGFFAKLLKRK